MTYISACVGVCLYNTRKKQKFKNEFFKLFDNVNELRLDQHKLQMGSMLKNSSSNEPTTIALVELLISIGYFSFLSNSRKFPQIWIHLNSFQFQKSVDDIHLKKFSFQRLNKKMCLSLKLCVCVGASLSGGCYGQRRENPDEWNHANHTHNILRHDNIAAAPGFSASSPLLGGSLLLRVCVSTSFWTRPTSRSNRFRLSPGRSSSSSAHNWNCCVVYSSCTLFLLSCSFFDVLVHRDLIVV